jgi:hypothetical protein
LYKSNIMNVDLTKYEYTPLKGEALKKAILEHFNQSPRFLNLLHEINSLPPAMKEQFDEALKDYVKSLKDIKVS